MPSPHHPARPPSSRLPARLAPLIAPLLALAASASSAGAQPLGVEFAEQPLTLDSIGLTLPVPKGSRAQAATPGSPVAARIVPENADWSISIQLTEAQTPSVRTADFTDGIIRRVREAYGVVRSGPNMETKRITNSRAEVLDRSRDLRVAGLEADRVYLRVPDDTAEERAIAGYTVVRLSPRRFVVFQLSAPASEFESARALFQTTIAAADFDRSRQDEVKRGASVLRGRDLLLSISTDEFDRLVQSFEGRWERLYRPAPPGADAEPRELGYRRVRAWKGMRGEIQIGADPENFDTVESQRGYLVAIDARLLDADGQTTDVASRYFLTPDASEEAWSIRMTLRRDERIVSNYVENGVRVDSTLKVSLTASGQPAETVRPLIQGLGYISQVQTYLLPELLIETGAPGEYGFYAYETSKQTIAYRATHASRDERTGQWTIETTIAGADEPRVSTYNAQSRFQRTRLPDGRVWERTTLEDLLELWRRNGLPVR